MDDITAFIRNFHGSEDTFLHGCCYWFAHILNERFHSGQILYEPVEGHFIYGVSDAGNIGSLHGQDCRYYDVRGDVTDLYVGAPLYTMDFLIENEPGYYTRLMRDCRDFIQQPA